MLALPPGCVMPISRIFILSLAALSVAAAKGPAQVVGFVTHLGRDTVAFERAEWRDGRLTGTFVQTLPRMRIVEFSLGYRPNGQVGDFTASAHDAIEGPGARPSSHFVVTFGNDTTVAIVSRLGKIDTTRFVTDVVPIPYLLNCWSLMEVLTRRAAKTRPDASPSDGTTSAARHCRPRKRAGVATRSRWTFSPRC